MVRDFLVPGTPLGIALLEARRQLAKAQDYEWPLFHLLGDPSYVMVKEK